MDLSAFRPDVRLILDRDRVGLHRGLGVAWLPAPAGHLLWREGPGVLGQEVADELARLGLTGPADGNDDVDRNRVFLDALCDDPSDIALDAIARSTMIIGGCGGLGSNLAVILAAAGARRFVLVDGDRIERGNLNRLLWADAEAIGTAKVAALARHLADRFGAQCVTVPAFVSASSMAEVAQRHVFRQPAQWFLTIDDAAMARDALRGLLTHLSPGGDFPSVYHAGYVGRHCIVGPLLQAPGDACPFCGGGETRFAPARFVAPSAAPNNLLIASFLAAQALIELTGGASAIRGARWCLDLARGEAAISPLAKDPACSICSTGPLSRMPSNPT